MYKETIPYLAGSVFKNLLFYILQFVINQHRNTTCILFLFRLALLIVSDEIRAKLRPNSALHARPKSIPESQSTLTPPNSMPVSPVTITIESPISPGPAQVSDVETEVFLWPAEVENRLLDPGVVNDTQTQALLLTTLVRRYPAVWVIEIY